MASARKAAMVQSPLHPAMSRTNFLSSSRPRGVFRSRHTLFCPRHSSLNVQEWLGSSSRVTRRRKSRLVRDSILITSAPRSPSRPQASGPTAPQVSPTTSSPSSAGRFVAESDASSTAGVRNAAAPAACIGADFRSEAGVREKLQGSGANGASPSRGNPVAWKKPRTRVCSASTNSAGV